MFGENVVDVVCVGVLMVYYLFDGNGDLLFFIIGMYISRIK